MALPVKFHKTFTKRVSKVYDFLSIEWNPDVAENFLHILRQRVAAIQNNSALGSMTSVKGVRSISITKHNRLFYKTYPDRIAILYLKDTRKRTYKR